MKVLIMSDSHGRTDLVKEIMNRHICDSYIHCGDSEMDVPLINLELVRGNSYLDPQVPWEIVVKVDEYNIFVTHGHKYGIEFGVRKLAYRAHELGCTIVCFGHTHIFVNELIDGILFLNPGALTHSRKGVESYVIFDTMSNKCSRFNLQGEEI